MRSRLFWYLTMATVLACLASGMGGVRRGSLDGPVLGVWELPPLGSEGFLAGALLTFGDGEPLYELTATLTDVGVACPTCLVGEIRGRLDDGTGSGPDYLVEGVYVGETLDGAGDFVARLLRPNGTPAGRIRGTFQDPSGTDPGTFRGRFLLRR